MKTNYFFKAFITFILVLCIFVFDTKYINCENIDKSFEILHDGDIIYNGEDEVIYIQVDCSYFAYYQIKINGEVPDFGAYFDGYSKTLSLYPELLKGLQKGTSVLTLTLFYTDNPDDFSSADINIVSTVLTQYNADLVIKDKYHPVLYTKDEQSASDIDGLKIIKPKQDENTYIIELEKDVELTAYNAECILTNFGYNLQIIGPHTLTIISDHDNEYTYNPVINTSGGFILGDKNVDYITKLIINDPFVLNNKDKDALLCAYTFGIWSDKEINLYNSNIVANITSSLINAEKGIEVINTSIEHNSFANFKIPEGSYCSSATLSNFEGMFLINNSTIKTKIIPSDYYADVSMQCIYAGKDYSVEETDNYIQIKDSTIEFDPIPLNTDGTMSMFMESEIKTYIDNCDINVKNSTYGIYTMDSMEILNSDIQIDSNKGNIICGNSLKLTYNDEKEHIFNLTTNQEELIDYDEYFPSIFIYVWDESEEVHKMVEAPIESFIIELPENTEISSNDEKIDIRELFKYKSIYFKTKETKPDPEHKEEHNSGYKMPNTGIY